MSVTKFLIRKNQYYDSVFLMGINKGLLGVPGVIESAVLMGTENNKKLLKDIHIVNDEINQSSANDLIVAVIAETESSAVDAFAKLDVLLVNPDSQSAEVKVRTQSDGLRKLPTANLAVISVPGEFAAREAKNALENDLSVFLFSSNVPVSDEIKLKHLAREKNLLLMGPDCGTSIIGGKGIGFANRVRRGPVGVIGPSGTGIQEFTCLIHNSGLGISHAIGTGTRDLVDDIGGITTFMALDQLEKDPQTEVVVIVSKPAGQKTLLSLLDRAINYNKPLIGCFLGIDSDQMRESEMVGIVDTVDDAARMALQVLQHESAFMQIEIDDSRIELDVSKLSPGQKYLRGLFAGGTFCYQSQQILAKDGHELYSNEPLPQMMKLPDPEKSIAHSLIDMGDEYFTTGKPHPMLDGTMRSVRILDEGRDPETAIILLDFILGFNSSNDPVGEALESIIKVQKLAESEKRHVIFVSSITGTDDDPQDLHLQRKMLEDAGVLVFPSNASAAAYCSKLLKAMDRLT